MTDDDYAKPYIEDRVLGVLLYEARRLRRIADAMEHDGLSDEDAEDAAIHAEGDAYLRFRALILDRVGRDLIEALDDVRAELDANGVAVNASEGTVTVREVDDD